MNSQRENIRLGQGETFRLLRWSRTVASVEVVLGPGRTSAVAGQGDHWHYHPAVELTLIQRGAGTRLIADNIELFEAGDLVLIGPNVPHYWHLRGPSTGLALQWDFPREHAIWGFGEAAPLRLLTEFARRGLHLHGATATFVQRKLEELAGLEGLHRLSAFFQILAGLAGASAADVRPLSAHSFSLSGDADTQESIRRVVSFILAHYREPIHLPQLLELTGMSRATFARQFLLHAGKPFSTFRNQVRLRAVCHALRDTNEPVGHIAFSHGFNQLSFFNRLFHREFGLSPSAYRKGENPRHPPSES
jgi:AraC-like DNA-binding protein/mannose-6-phosphate isomerase-like protein (cupin superfamily)